MKDILREITTNELKDYLQDDVKSEELATHLLKMCKSFSYKYVLNGYDNQDYVQDLFMNIWEKLNKFDSERSRLSTFCFLYCKSYYFNWLRKNKLSVSLTLNRGEETEIIDIIADSGKSQQDILEFNEIYDMCEPMTKMYLDNYTYKEVSESFGCSRKLASLKIRDNIQKIKNHMMIN